MSNIQDVKLSYTKNIISENSRLYVPVQNTLQGCLQHWDEVQGQKEAFVFVSESDRSSVTWNELNCKVTNVAKAMIKLGVKKDDYIVVYLPDSPGWLYIVFGAILAGARPIPFYYVDKTWDNVVDVLDKLGQCSMIVVEKTKDQHLLENILGQVDQDGRVKSKRFPYLQYLLYQDGLDNKIENNGNILPSLLMNSNDAIELPKLCDDDIVQFVFSSGSTGPPKIISYTQKTFVLNGYRYVDYYKYLEGGDLIIYNDRPFAWAASYPFTVTCGVCRVTCTMVNDISTSETRIKKVIDTINAEKCTIVILLPSSIPYFIGVKLPENWPVKIVKIAGNLPSRRMFSLLGSFTKFIQIVYGSAEMRSVSATFIQREQEYKPYCVGRLHPGIHLEVKIVNDDGQIVPLGVRGEVYVRNDVQFHSYVNDPDKTSSVKTKDGWCRSDDIGMMKEENGEVVLYVYCRKSNIIMTDQNKILPELIEQAIEKINPDIVQAIIVPVPDEISYQALCACVKLNPGYSLDIESMNKQFKQLQEEQPAAYKAIPKYWMVVNEFPKCHNGKPSRPSLAKMAKQFLNLEYQ